ncbi:hypothetical protein KM043_003686 [Ampulex compressa]|nr:hypothetical protein KM043_003686 [Ampulex compressa]
MEEKFSPLDSEETSVRGGPPTLGSPRIASRLIFPHPQLREQKRGLRRESAVADRSTGEHPAPNECIPVIEETGARRGQRETREKRSRRGKKPGPRQRRLPKRCSNNICSSTGGSAGGRVVVGEGSHAEGRRGLARVAAHEPREKAPGEDARAGKSVGTCDK